jgi:hypothetical protein
MPRYLLIDRSFRESGRKEHQEFMDRKFHRTPRIPDEFDERGNLQLIEGVVAYNHFKDGEPVETYVPGYFVSERMTTPGTKKQTTFRQIEVRRIPKAERPEVSELLKRHGYTEPIHFSY